MNLINLKDLRQHLLNYLTDVEVRKSTLVISHVLGTHMTKTAFLNRVLAPVVDEIWGTSKLKDGYELYRLTNNLKALLIHSGLHPNAMNHLLAYVVHVCSDIPNLPKLSSVAIRDAFYADHEFVLQVWCVEPTTTDDFDPWLPQIN